MFPLNSIYLNPTDRCNLRCAHCWVAPIQDEKVQVREGEITLDEIKSAVEQAIPLGLSMVKLTGGEPFLRPDVAEMVEFFHSRDLFVSIETNGTLVEPGLVKRIGPLLSGVSVSLDGMESTHDQWRGVPGAFSDALRGARLFVDAGVETQIIFSLHRRNARELFDVLRLTRETGVHTLKINPVLPVGRGHALAKKGFTLGVDEILDLYREIKAKAGDAGTYLYFTLPVAFRSVKDVMDGDISECAVLNIMGIMGNGDISICGIEKVTGDLMAGNVSKDPIAEVWRDAPVFNRLRREVPRDMEGICGRCMFKKLCLGACRALSHYETGSFTSAYYFCRIAEEMGLFPRTRCIE